MSASYRALVKAKAGKTVEIDAGHRGNFTLGENERPISSDLLGLALYLQVVAHADVEVSVIEGHPTNPPGAKKSLPGSKPLGPTHVNQDGDVVPDGKGK